MRELRYVAVKIAGTACVQDLRTMTVTPCAGSSDAVDLADGLNDRFFCSSRCMWFELVVKKHGEAMRGKRGVS